jgi:acyl-CoA synthetase (AMP-forming)/AMP-acid ligase II
VPRPPLEATCGDTRALLEAAAVVHGDREAYVEPGGRITFADWVGRACAVALQFAAAGVGKGDVVALWLPSGIDYATSYAAATMIGAITTGLNPRLGPREIEAVVTQADPSLIVADPRLGVIDTGGRPVLSRESLARDCERSDSLPAVTLDPADPVTIIFTSGPRAHRRGRCSPLPIWQPARNQRVR